ncbi:hypothetical protein INR49_014947 [Caranx melampygus]|nr:hypothetical protein INR49_014947 [Caranx melampygus]
MVCSECILERHRFTGADLEYYLRALKTSLHSSSEILELAPAALCSSVISVTQEEVLICPSHAAVLANYSDLMCALAGICGDARCYCIHIPAPSVNIEDTARGPGLMSCDKLLRTDAITHKHQTPPTATREKHPEQKTSSGVEHRGWDVSTALPMAFSPYTMDQAETRLSVSSQTELRTEGAARATTVYDHRLRRSKHPSGQEYVYSFGERKTDLGVVIRAVIEQHLSAGALFPTFRQDNSLHLSCEESHGAEANPTHSVLTSAGF